MKIAKGVSTAVEEQQDHKAIYQNGLAQYPGRMDLTRLDLEEQGLSFRVLEMLLAKNSEEIRFQTSSELGELFWHLYSEQRNLERLKGTQAMGLGYPIIASGKGEERLVMPVIIWEFKLEPSPYRTNEWEIRRPSYAFSRINPVFENWAVQKGVKEILQSLSDQPDAKELAAWLQDLALALELESASQTLAIEPFPKLETLDATLPQNALWWSGVMAVFPVLSVMKKEEVAVPVLEEVPVEGHAFGMMAQDPFQASALEAVRRQNLCWVEGESGSGKTHLMIQIISMALANGQKCLVVSPTMGALKQIQDELARMGMQKLQYLIRNPQTDTGMLMDFLRAMIDSPPSAPRLDNTQFKIYLDRCEREKQKLDDRYFAIRQKVFGQADWAETVGQYLHSNRKVGKELLGMQLYTQDFAFNFEEFEDLSGAIDSAHPLFQPLNTLKHPLTVLHPNIFLNMEKEEGQAFVEDRTAVFHGQCTRLQRRYFAKVNQYGEALRKHYEQHYRDLSTRLISIKEKIAEGINRYGRPFEETTMGSLRVSSFFSGVRKEILKEKRQLAEQYSSLKQKFDLFEYFDANLPDIGEGPVKDLIPALNAFEESLDAWQNSHSAIIQEGVFRLNRKTVHSRLHLGEDIEELEDNLDYLLGEINSAQLFEAPLEHQMLTVPKRQKYLEGVIEQLETTRRSLKDFSVFYDWQKNWLGLSKPAHKLIHAMVKVKPRDWQAALESWYFHHCLNRAYTPRLPEGDDGLEAFVDAFEKLQPMLAESIRQQWEFRRSEAVRRLKTDHRELHQILLNRLPGEGPPPADEIRMRWKRGLPVVSEILPVLLVGDSAIPFLPENPEKAFDYILIDEAQLLTAGQIESLRAFGKRVLLTTNPALEALPGAGKWPQQWRNAGITAHNLAKSRHRNPGNLMQLSQQGQSVNSTIGGHSTIFEQVNGRYHENQQVNQTEAEFLITMLNRIEKTPQRTFPTVGIVCLTIQQRDLVQQLLFRIKKKDEAGADTVRQLERNGLGVFFIDELIGQHFDILILSGTFGQVNTRGQLSRHLQQLDQSKWLSRMKLLMGCAEKGVYILNSIPLGELKKMAESASPKGRFIYANYLLYLKYLSEWKLAAQEEVLNRVRAAFKEDENKNERLFPKQLVEELRLYLRNERLETAYKDGDLQFPLLVHAKEEGGASIVIQPDGFFAKTPATDYQWEFQQREKLKERGYAFLPTWSVKWWKETSLEAKRLAGTLINLLEEKE